MPLLLFHQLKLITGIRINIMKLCDVDHSSSVQRIEAQRKAFNAALLSDWLEWMYILAIALLNKLESKLSRIKPSVSCLPGR